MLEKTKQTWCRFGRYFEASIAIVIFVIALSSALAFWQSKGDGLVEAVTFISAKPLNDHVLVGGDLDVRYQFLKNRSDCHAGRVKYHAWNSAGVWREVKASSRAKQYPVSDQPQTIIARIQMIDVETGKPVPPGSWALNAVIAYDCPHRGRLEELDDAIDTPPFKIVAIDQLDR